MGHREQELRAMLSEAAEAAAAVHDPELERIRRDFPRWRIWRAEGASGPGSWVATRRVDDDVEPTIVADSPAELRRRLANPSKRAGRHLSTEQIAAIEAELAQ